MTGPLRRAVDAPPHLALLMRSDVDRRVRRDTIADGSGPAASLRVLADRLEAEMHQAGDPAPGAGGLYAAALLQTALLAVIARYAEEQHPGVLSDALEAAAGTLDVRPEATLSALAGRFALGALPEGPEGHLAGLLLLEAERANPQLAFLHPLLAEREGEGHDVEPLLGRVEEWLSGRQGLEAGAPSLPELLRAPARAGATLDEQIAWVIATWGDLLPPSLRTMLLRARDLLQEETRLRQMHGGPGSAPVMDFQPGPGLPHEPEYERFSKDREWMPNVVLMARQTHVWLDQLRRRYGREIRRLDQIPDEELDLLASRGFTALWLIGLWERSNASAEIKRRCGNPEAVASAYSLYDYSIAEALGGEAACDDLRRRAWARGIRLAADMVPNHFGIDSRWLIEHPERFLSLQRPPYPCYRFDGPDLGGDRRVGVYIEDGYWRRSDAAVCFKRVDRATGDVRFVYHGNDGTQMPWNDTAQLDYLSAEVREAVIQTIVQVARRFPVIRFDAAMTLARRHVQRLWYPPPGEGGAIPSRSENSVSPEEFSRRMPAEFWRELVDRVAAEVPDTLLLAEAFWLMEGYFVRTLGMHRVYNSAFMHMLRDEDNAKYRQTLKNVLEYSPAVLERFVNFMNNPDEESAAEQYGTQDKYFGVATLLSTLPGLPMFGHGQVEGFREKYGMEYARAYWDERPDDALVAHHERAIFPLLRRRALFSGVSHFVLYDVVTETGQVDENVFAYSNRSPDGGERALVVYNNCGRPASGRIMSSVASNAGSVEDPRLQRTDLSAGMAIVADDGVFYGFRDLVSGLWFLRAARELCERGLFVDLDGYGSQVLLDWRELRDPTGRWEALARSLGGRGVPDLEAAANAGQPEAPREARQQGEPGGETDPDLVRTIRASGVSATPEEPGEQRREDALPGAPLASGPGQDEASSPAAGMSPALERERDA